MPNENISHLLSNIFLSSIYFPSSESLVRDSGAANGNVLPYPPINFVY